VLHSRRVFWEGARNVTPTCHMGLIDWLLHGTSAQRGYQFQYGWFYVDTSWLAFRILISIRRHGHVGLLVNTRNRSGVAHALASPLSYRSLSFGYWFTGHYLATRMQFNTPVSCLYLSSCEPQVPRSILMIDDVSWLKKLWSLTSCMTFKIVLFESLRISCADIMEFFAHVRWKYDVYTSIRLSNGQEYDG